MKEKMILQQKSNIKEAIDNILYSLDHQFIDNTVKNYSFESIYHQIDNLDSTQSHHTYKHVKYNDEKQIMLIGYNTFL